MNSIVATLTHPTAGNCPMLNSDRDLDISPNCQVARSPSLQSPHIATELSVEQSKAMPIFTEATTQAVLLADVPVAILTIVAGSSDRIAAIAGLEQFLSLPPNPDLLLEFAGLDYCHAQVLDRGHSLSIPNCQQYPQLAQSSLCHKHGIQAYLGVPIVTAARDRLGTIAVLDFQPRQFSDRDVELLQLLSRLVASEFERKLLSQAQLNRWVGDLPSQSLLGFDDTLAAAEYLGTATSAVDDVLTDSLPPDAEIAPNQTSIQADPIATGMDIGAAAPQVHSEIQFKLLTHLAQELRTPLTAVVGMASVLEQEIYGPLSSKQKDYLGIIHHSGQQLVAIVDEISQLGEFNRHQQLTLNLVNLEMLCQLALQRLEPLAQKKQQQLILLAGSDTASEFQVDPTSPTAIRIWLLDKEKVRQIVYYLCLSLIQVSAIDCQISIQCSTLIDGLQIQIVTNDPQVLLRNRVPPDEIESIVETTAPPSTYPRSSTNETNLGHDLRISLGLSLSHNLAALHNGKIEAIADGRGYQLTLPLIVAVGEQLRQESLKPQT